MFARRHDRLGAVEHPALARAFGTGAHLRQVIARFRLGLGQRGGDGACDQALQRFTLGRRAGRGDGAAHHQGVQERLAAIARGVRAWRSRTAR
ncbi:hypothetical protein G6F68_019980 [Rhizopus microsporus]|nr:hypothetical protein G6F68_019980 [Rhizopus microsporus]